MLCFTVLVIIAAFGTVYCNSSINEVRFIDILNVVINDKKFLTLSNYNQLSILKKVNSLVKKSIAAYRQTERNNLCDYVRWKCG